MWSKRFLNYYYTVRNEKPFKDWLFVALHRNFMGEKRWFGY